MLLADILEFLKISGGYNTIVVLTGATALGMGAGIVGVFPLLRRRALVSDAVSHATLPGIVLGFLIASLFDQGRYLPALMIGATLSSIAGAAAVHWIRTRTRLPEDTAIASVLGVFFGIGVVLLTHVQTLQTGSAAGLEDFLLGSTASLTAGQALMIGASALLVATVTMIFFKEFAVLAFDETQASVQGLNGARLDLAIMGLLVAIVVIGLQTVGLILIIALVIIPPATARLWTERLKRMLVLSGLFGGLSGSCGVWISVVVPDVPAGSAIVLVSGTIFALSLLCAPSRGAVAWALARRKMKLRLKRAGLLLALANGTLARDQRSRAAAVRWGLLDRKGRPTPAGLAAARTLANTPRPDLATIDSLTALLSNFETGPGRGGDDHS